jgi:hypothetical protein
MEHVAAPLGSWPRSLQELVNPAWKRIADGCHVNRCVWVVAGISTYVLVMYEGVHCLTGQQAHTITCGALHASLWLIIMFMLSGVLWGRIFCCCCCCC